MKRIKRIGEMLIDAGVITEEQLKEALELQKRNGKRLGSILLELGYATEDDILKVLSEQFGNVPVAKKRHFESIQDEVIKLIPAHVAARYDVVPLAVRGNKLFLAMANPEDHFAIEDVRFLTKFEVIPLIALEDFIKEAIKKYYKIEDMMDQIAKIESEDMGIEVLTGSSQIERKETKELIEGSKNKAEIKSSESEQSIEEILVYGDDIELAPEKVEDEAEDITSIKDEKSPIVKIVNAILYEAIRRRASDIHIEPYEKELRVRYRIDGVLQEVLKRDVKLIRPIVARIKGVSKMKIEEKRKPQDGRIRLKMGDKRIDVRVAVIPTVYGEKVAMRILDRSAIELSLDVLGFEEESLKIFRKILKNPNGIILVTGPTGSGKTTTLYSALQELNSIDVNISTVEDPVEFTLHGINQVQVKESVGMTFAAGLKAFLRQDPDIIMVGEIRDLETAEIAIRASLTGHLVLSTVHTNTAAATITRLINMEIEPFLIASTLLVVVSQRLVRKICENCKEEYTPDESVLFDLSPDNPDRFKGIKFYRGKGCEKCFRIGYKGRTGLFEVMPITKKIRELILKKAPTFEIEKAALEEGMISLRETGIRKILKGITTPEEVLKETKIE
ncbi:MAG: ATPase, T2SS/T4P/T4SS family [Candidatus Hydrothermales bacterium]